MLVAGLNCAVVTATTCKWSTADGYHTSQLLQSVTHCGPERQAWDDCNCAADIPLVSKSLQ